MRGLQRRMKYAVGLGMMVLSASCANQVLCELGTYDRGFGQCPAERYALKVSLATDRTDLRSPASLPIQIQAIATDINQVFRVKQVKSVQLDLDGTTVTDVQHTLDEAAQSAVVTRSPEQLKLGALRATVMLDGLAPSQTDGLHRVFRSPKLAPAVEVTGMTTSTNRSGTVTGRATVQVASPVGVPGQLLALEEVTAGGMQLRWLDLYAQGADSALVHANNSQWQVTQDKLQQGPAAQEVLVQGAVVIYDYYGMTNRVDLALQPLLGNVQAGLSAVESRIPTDALTLAGCSEESVILLARPSEVLAFQTNPGTGSVAVAHLASVATQGTAVIATRDALGAAPSQRSADYFAVVWDGSGKGTLLKLVKAAGIATGVEMGPDVSGAAGGRGPIAAALADLDSDGLQDLILAAADGTLMWSPQHPDKSFALAEPLGVAAPRATSISVGDVNLDGLPDVAVATSDKRLLIFRNEP
ncbi:MAG TPA: VCBS repeat-containing protein [Pseudomonadota bacterium]|nr:VCBS repeat-containing protein [Pseudomonadota bacterium]